MIIKINTPIAQHIINDLNSGDYVELTGTIYTARDQAHKKLTDAILANKSLPVPVNSVLYYAGPSPARPGEVIGSCGPTTSARMDQFTPLLVENGFKVCIGKGLRNKNVLKAIKKNKGLYLSAFGGCGALYHNKILKAECIAYKDLLSEAIFKLYVENFPAVVAIDSKGNDIFTKEPL
ncbi:MAG: TRZ/ATZ family protein [bacterium]|nr:TRZ/ATZ family protein [bacterium]